MDDIPLKNALLLWNAGLDGKTPAFAVRPLGHLDLGRYDYGNGAGTERWDECADLSDATLLAKAMVELWHIVMFSKVPVELVHAEMLKVPEYRNMLADECLPPEFLHERYNVR